MFLAAQRSLGYAHLSKRGQELAQMVLKNKFSNSKELQLFLQKNFSQPFLPENFGSLFVPIISNPLRAEHEKYFAIQRIETKSADLILENLCRSLLLTLEDCEEQGSKLPDAIFLNLWKAMQGVASFLTSQPVSHDELEQTSHVVMDNIANPMKRWMNGHYLFFSLIQALILVHRNMAHASSSFQVAADLFIASISAFRYGAHYSSHDYQEVVRPTMGPPNYSPGFSDQNSLDHIELLSCMAKVKKEFCPKDIPPAERVKYVQAVATLYDNHALVCEKAVGNTVSLQQAAQGEMEALSAPDTIRITYKNRTLGLIDKKSE